MSHIRSSSTHVSVDEQLYIPRSGRPSSSPFAPLLFAGKIKSKPRNISDHDSSGDYDPELHSSTGRTLVLRLRSCPEHASKRTPGALLRCIPFRFCEERIHWLGTGPLPSSTQGRARSGSRARRQTRSAPTPLMKVCCLSLKFAKGHLSNALADCSITNASTLRKCAGSRGGA